MHVLTIQFWEQSLTLGVKPYILNLISFYWHPLQVRLSRELVKCWISVDVGSCRQNSEMHDVSTHTLVEISCGSGWLTWLTVWEKLLPRLHDVCWVCISTPQTSSKKSVLSIFFGKWVGSGYSNTTSCLLFDRRVEANYLSLIQQSMVVTHFAVIMLANYGTHCRIVFVYPHLLLLLNCTENFRFGRGMLFILW